MTNPANVVVIVEKLTNYLRTATDVYVRTELVSRINQLAEKCVLIICLLSLFLLLAQ
jgi:hypothetical protein